MTAAALPLRTRPNGDDGMGPDGPPPWPNPTPTQFLRIGRPPRLPRRARQARLLRRVGWYSLGWVLFAGTSYFLVLGDVAIWLALLIPVAYVTNPFTRRVRRPVTGLPAPAHAHHSPRAGNAGGRLTPLRLPGAP